MNTRITEMLEELSHAPDEVRPSKFWIELNNKNIHQLETEGYENFKRTITRNYFNWVGVGVKPPMVTQFRYLWQHLAKTSFVSVSIKTLFALFSSGLSLKHTLSHVLTRLVWAYGLQVDKANRLESLAEPEEGNPFRIYYGKKLISQDMANGFLEYQATMDSVSNPDAIRTVLELGAGYGRTGYVYLKLNPNIRYIVVDIPPALYISERYLSNQFTDRKIFKFRPFERYEDIAQEFEQAQIAFLLPQQMALLPDKSVDLFVNISSLHEMLPHQISYYLNQVDRLTNGYFYMKQWRKWYNAVDKLEVSEKDYPIPKQWTSVFWRPSRVQTLFFEALFRI